MAFFCAGATHGAAKKRAQGTQIGPGSKPASLSQGSPVSPVLNNLADRAGDERGKSQDLTLTLPHSNTQDMKKKMIVVQKYEPKPGDIHVGLGVNRGDTVLLIREEGEWLYVKNENGEEGFVPRSHLLSPSATRTRTNSRSGTGLRQVIQSDKGQREHQVANGSVPMHPSRSADRPQILDNTNVRILSPHSQDEYSHHMTNGHPPTLTAATFYDQKYSPSSSSGVASLADPISPSSNQSPTQENEQAQSSSSSLNHSNGSFSSYEHSLDRNSQPTLVSPLNHIEGGNEALNRNGGVESDETISRTTSGRTTSESNFSSTMVHPSQNGAQRNMHYIDETTNHVYSTLEDSSVPPPVPPRRIPGYSASQDPDSTYSQLDHHTVRLHKTRSQEALIHPSHHHQRYTEGWTKEKLHVPQATQHGTTVAPKPRPANYKEMVEIRHAGRKSGTRSAQGEAKVARVTPTKMGGERMSQTPISKFRKTFWGVFVVTTDFEPLDENEVSIQKGEHVSVWNQDDREWFWIVKHTSSSSEEGFVPSVCLREVSTESKPSSTVESVDSLRHSSHTTPSSSPRPEDPNRMRSRSRSHESRSAISAHRPSSGSHSSSSRRARQGSDSSSQSHGLQNRAPSSLSIKKEELPPSPPSSPPPPYTEFDANRRFVSLSQQPPDGHQHQHGYNPAMHRTRSQGYVTSRTRVQRYPSPSTPQGERSGEGSSYPSSNEGTLV